MQKPKKIVKNQEHAIRAQRKAVAEVKEANKRKARDKASAESRKLLKQAAGKSFKATKGVCPGGKEKRKSSVTGRKKSGSNEDSASIGESSGSKTVVDVTMNGPVVKAPKGKPKTKMERCSRLMVWKPLKRTV